MLSSSGNFQKNPIIILFMGCAFLILSIQILGCSDPINSNETSKFHPEDGTWIISSTPTTQDIIDIQFINNSVGWAHSFGQLLKSVDGGYTWNIQEINSESLISSIYFLSEKLGWVVLEDNLIIKTLDGGTTWHTYSTTEGGFYQDLFFLNDSIGWLAGWGTGFFKSTDGSATWLKMHDLNADERIKTIFFLNENSGWISCHQTFFLEGRTFGTGYVYRTKDGGLNWQRTANLGNNWDIGRIQFFNENEGIVNYNGILKSSDGGITWEPFIDGNFNGIYFHNLSYGWLAGYQSTWNITVTTNGGLTYSTFIDTDGDKYKFIETIFFYDEYNGWAAGRNGKILKFLAAD